MKNMKSHDNQYLEDSSEVDALLLPGEGQGDLSCSIEGSRRESPVPYTRDGPEINI